MTEMMEPNFICSVCWHGYFGVGTMRFCPNCADVKAEKKKEWWKAETEKRVGEAQAIVKRILENMKNG